MNKQLFVITMLMTLIGVNGCSAMEKWDPEKRDLHYCAAEAKMDLETCFYSNYHNYRQDLLKQLTHKDGDGNIPLHEAAAYGRLKNVKKLLILLKEIKKDDAINMRNYKGETPLDKAIYFKKKAVEKYLRKQGAKKGNEL